VTVVSLPALPPSTSGGRGWRGTCFWNPSVPTGGHGRRTLSSKRTWITRSPAVSHHGGGQIPSISADPAIGGRQSSPHPPGRPLSLNPPKSGGSVGFRGDALAEMPEGKPRAQLAFKDSMIRGILQFTLRIAFRCVLHRCRSQDIRC
jgi:hypothetical protein